MMRRKLKWLLLGLASYLLMLIATLPMRPVYDLFATKMAPLSLQGVQGKLWNGQASAVHYNNIGLGSINWSFKPTELLSGQFGFDFINQDNQTHSTGIAGMSMFGKTYLDNVSGHAPASNLYKMLGSYPLNLSGKILYDIQQLRLNNNVVELIQGTMTWQKAAIQAPFPAELGTIEVQLSSEQENMLLQISNKGGQLGVQGSVKVLKDKRIQSDIRIIPRKNADPGLVNILRSFGKADRSGTITIIYNGYI